MNMEYFKRNIEPKLNGYKLTYSSYPSGDFGSLERVVIDGQNKTSIVDIWSKGWLNIEIIDFKLEDQIMNVMLEPTEIKEQKDAINKLISMLLVE